MVQPQSKLDVVIESPTSKHQEHAVKPYNIENQEKTKKKPSVIANINASYFRICISLAGQALLWKTLSEDTNMGPTFRNLFLKLPSTAFFLLWCLSLCVLVSLSILYVLRCIFYFNMVKAEFHHHVGVNYLFAPWISWLLLLLSAPSFILRHKYSCEYLWWLLIIPVVGLDVKVYGQWFTTEKRFLSMVANPTSQLSRLSGSNHIPSKLRPVFFLFVAAPSMAALAWKSIKGSFDIQCKMLFFLSLFLFTSLASRPMLFKKSVKEFSVAWWAFSFPLTFLALAATAYAQQVKSLTATGLAVVLSTISVLVFLLLLVFSTLKIDSLLHKPILKFSNDSVSYNLN
ncbi:unnamed protein product [Lactuca virosa]|uniref:Voltage-dependent anion channel n=1 Tax=Lactuca virosa TaxID=75947 RepID=A0AAU9PDT8_9ASTR|nr:unnamed protein product [Lactuca virosa]